MFEAGLSRQKKNVRDAVVEYASDWFNKGMKPIEECEAVISALESVQLFCDDRIIKELLFQIKSQHSDVKVRRELLRTSENITVEKLYEMAEDSKASIRYNVAVHPKVTIDLLDKFSTDPAVSVRIGAARSLLATAELLTFLSKDKNASVWLAVAKNPNTTAEILEELSHISRTLYEGILKAIAGHANTATHTLEKLAKAELRKLAEDIGCGLHHFSSKILVSLAQNPNTPIAILQRLVNVHNFHCSSPVRWYARKNLEERS